MDYDVLDSSDSLYDDTPPDLVIDFEARSSPMLDITTMSSTPSPPILSPQRLSPILRRNVGSSTRKKRKREEMCVEPQPETVNNEDLPIVQVSDKAYLNSNAENFSNTRNDQMLKPATIPRSLYVQEGTLLSGSLNDCREPESKLSAPDKETVGIPGLNAEEVKKSKTLSRIEERRMKQQMKDDLRRLYEMLPNNAGRFTSEKTLLNAVKRIEDLQNKFIFLMKAKYNLDASQILLQIRLQTEPRQTMFPRIQKAIDSKMRGGLKQKRLDDAFLILREILLGQPETDLQILQSAISHIRGFEIVNRGLEMELFMRCCQLANCKLLQLLKRQRKTKMKEGLLQLKYYLPE